ncbi:MAG: hypothetical protein QW568_04840 [Candidatus Anstonellaceae archaeon]
MRNFAFVLVFAAAIAVLSGISFAITTGNCADGTAYGKCSTANPGQYCTGSLSSPTLGTLVSVCPCSNFPGYTQQGSGESATCVATKCGNINAFSCDTANKPKYCVNGALIDNSTACGCPTGKRVAADKLTCEWPPCDDGGIAVPDGQCSPKKQKKCVNGQLVDKASECGCKAGTNVTGETCSIFCSDGTKDGTCSTAKPKKCVNGYLLEKAAECGCPEGKTAVGNQCTDAIFGDLGGGELLGGGSNSSNESGVSGGSPSALSCCLPTALIGLVGGFAFFRKKK